MSKLLARVYLVANRYLLVPVHVAVHHMRMFVGSRHQIAIPSTPYYYCPHGHKQPLPTNNLCQPAPTPAPASASAPAPAPRWWRQFGVSGTCLEELSVHLVVCGDYLQTLDQMIPRRSVYAFLRALGTKAIILTALSASTSSHCTGLPSKHCPQVGYYFFHALTTPSACIHPGHYERYPSIRF